jgi:hypothetical protein
MPKGSGRPYERDSNASKRSGKSQAKGDRDVQRMQSVSHNEAKQLIRETARSSKLTPHERQLMKRRTRSETGKDLLDRVSGNLFTKKATSNKYPYQKGKK